MYNLSLLRASTWSLMESNPIPPNPTTTDFLKTPNPDPSSIQVPGLDTTAPILDQIEQIEQLITIKLQNIDENFSKIHNILSNKILPAVKRYAVATKPVREAANFWVSFYEQAAQIRIPTYDDYSTVNEVLSERDELTSETESSSRTEESTVRHEDHSVTSTESSFMPGQAAFASTPATGRSLVASLSGVPSLTRLDREVQNFSREDSAASSKLPSLPSLRLDDIPEEERTVIRLRPDKGKSKEAEPLLQNVLRMSPPVLMSPARPPRSTAELKLLWGKTPAKEAAARIKNDLMRDVQRQNFEKATRGYGGESSMSTVSSPPSLSRYNRPDTDESVVDESLESQKLTFSSSSSVAVSIARYTNLPKPYPLRYVLGNLTHGDDKFYKRQISIRLIRGTNHFDLKSYLCVQAFLSSALCLFVESTINAFWSQVIQLLGLLLVVALSRPSGPKYSAP
ncbi:DASH complex subunit Ask1-domain-containing protein [Mycena sanguinolenta]|nr:DASH complex subunit Ask1-domain-containing protein [Mycena sanguinolenta]